MRTISSAFASLLVVVLSVTPAFAATDAKVVGYPDTPGVHANLACRKSPANTFNIFLPKAYAEKPKARFPVLFIMSNPGWLGLGAWAEANGVILVTINDVKNGDWAPVYAAQDAVSESVSAYRIHPTLRFATGLSGGGWASVKMAQRHPREIAGVILHCHSGNNDAPPPACRVGFIGGLSDTIHPIIPHIRDAAARFRKAGNAVWQENIPIGHTWAPEPVLSRMLSAMLLHARMTASGLSSEESREAEAFPRKLIAAAIGATNPNAACASLEPLLDDAFRSKFFYTDALDTWCSVRAKQLADLALDKALAGYAEDDTLGRFSRAPGKSRAVVEAFLKKLDGDAVTKAEAVALKEFAKMKESRDRDAARGIPKVMHDWAVRLDKFAKKNPGTLAGKKAAALAAAKA